MPRFRLRSKSSRDSMASIQGGVSLPSDASPAEPKSNAPTTPQKPGVEHLESNPQTIPVPLRLKKSISLDMLPATAQDPTLSVRSSNSSFVSDDTALTSPPPLQELGHNDEVARLEPITEDDPASYDLTAPFEGGINLFSLEDRADQIFSARHLKEIFADPTLFLKFTRFLGKERPQSLPILVYYLDATKALKAIQYANAIADALEPLSGYAFTESPVKPTANFMLQQRAQAAFDIILREDLPAYIAHVYVGVVTSTISRRILGTLPNNLVDASEGLAEVFCLTDPSRPDNPIVFASEEFYKTTQYGMSYAIGRNCRFLQGPRTNRDSVQRIRDTLAAGKDHTELFLNYRRDGSPFMNLLMTAALRDSRGRVRYHIGAQVDVSGLVKSGEGLEAILAMDDQSTKPSVEEDEERQEADCFQELSEMFNFEEIDTVRRRGGRMHRDDMDDSASIRETRWPKQRLVLTDASGDVSKGYHLSSSLNGKLKGVYQNYFLVRPYPALRVLFASPSLRTPGILQSPFLEKIGGSDRVRDEISNAMAQGRGITAKVRWIIKKGSETGRNRWIHCTPLLNGVSQIGVWMIIVVDDEDEKETSKRRTAPAVSTVISGHPDAEAYGHIVKAPSIASQTGIIAQSTARHDNRPDTPSSLVI